ncbi:MAG: hypothetical protein ACREQA_02515 [Candidatus Binatia bacterium]
MTAKEALDFVEEHGIVLESAPGPVPNLAERIVGNKIRGSWWAHRESRTIFNVTRAVRSSEQVLVCRLVEDKVTYVHRRLWPALVRMARKIPKMKLIAIREVHTEMGRHELKETPFPDWVPGDVLEESTKLSEDEATSHLEGFLPDLFGAKSIRTPKR